jgi:hypothetical protein
LSDEVNYTVKEAFHFKMHILKRGNNNTKSLAYTSLVLSILEYGAACWDPNREGQVNALHKVQKKAAKFGHHRKESNWDTLTERRKIARLCGLLKAYTGEWSWKAVGEQTPCYLRRGGHGKKEQKAEERSWETLICKYDHTALEPITCRCFRGSLLQTEQFRKRIRKVISRAK